ncbi:metalloprotease JAMM1, desampylating [Natronomonas moolapensis 8.8.11]|uniref:Metalloprotease JAMM1, desampylating n=1 Tax=Natronomonas moolapensis (strain DSM 18674 / CECT 7526 / JCM 14361 / 8.8.11) TaxID=268739 RepID=M1XZH7_NATM8|nr:desampylase [Natronomonas moolapensis]CCQ35571.1 metalloprotease JAMM1, desampylating [Natronomonas moolapensis 8.8.11]
MVLELSEPHRDAIVEHARGGAPEEVVGVLAGTNGETSRVERRYRAVNAAETPETRYEIAPEAELAILERIDDAGFDVVGFYHSHPRGPLEPSATDTRLAAWPGRSYVIVSLAGEDAGIGSWRWRGERFERESVSVVE